MHFTTSTGLGLGLECVGLGLVLGLEALSLESKSGDNTKIPKQQLMKTTNVSKTKSNELRHGLGLLL